MGRSPTFGLSVEEADDLLGERDLLDEADLLGDADARDDCEAGADALDWAGVADGVELGLADAGGSDPDAADDADDDAEREASAALERGAPGCELVVLVVVEMGVPPGTRA